MAQNTIEPGGTKDVGPSSNVTLGGSQSGSNGENFEDHFVNSLVGSVNKATLTKKKQESLAQREENLEKRWENFREEKSSKEKSQNALLTSPVNKGRDSRKNAPLDTFDMPGTVTDPSHPSFERQDNQVYKAGTSTMYPNPEQVSGSESQRKSQRYQPS